MRLSTTAIQREWFSYFNQTLQQSGLLTDAEYRRMQRAILQGIADCECTPRQGSVHKTQPDSSV